MAHMEGVVNLFASFYHILLANYGHCMQSHPSPFLSLLPNRVWVSCSFHFVTILFLSSTCQNSECPRPQPLRSLVEILSRRQEGPVMFADQSILNILASGLLFPACLSLKKSLRTLELYSAVSTI